MFAVPVWILDLSASDGAPDLVSGGATGQWEWGVATMVGPVGETSWGTNLDGRYLHDTVDWIEVQLPDLTAVEAPALILHHWFEIRPGDWGLVEADDGAGFLPLTPAYGYPDPAGFVGVSGGWVDHVFDLSGLGATPKIRMTLTADEMQTDDGWYVQQIGVWDGDILPPLIAILASPTDTQDLDGPYVVDLEVADDRGAISTTLWIQLDGGPATAIPMTPTTGDGWTAAIDGQPPDTLVDWWVDSTDGENVARWPAVGTEAFRVFLAAPTNLACPADNGRLVADTVELTWDPPDSPSPVSSYEVYLDDQPVPIAVVDQPPALVALGGAQQFWVAARYEAGLGDPSETLDLEIEVPTLTTLEPSTVYQGEAVHIAMAGSSRYLLQDEVTLDLGPDVEITGIDVRDAHALVAHATVDPAAAVGPVDITLGGAAGTFVFSDRFEIRDGADAPRIVRIAPAVILQGDELELALDATVPFAAVPVIGTDEDLLVTSAVTVDGTNARFVLAASGIARVGLHTLSVDDGERLYTVDVLVEEYVARIETGCRGGCETSPGSGPLGVMALWFTLRRRRAQLASIARIASATSLQGPITRRAGGRLRSTTCP